MGKPIAVHFGAGNIGRGFVGELLFKSGYDVYFLDVNEEMINRLNQEKTYEVFYAEEEKRKTRVTIPGAYHSISQKEKALELIKAADLITTAVGVSILNRVAPLIQEGLLGRDFSNGKKVNLIACENAVNASETLKEHVMVKELPEEYIGFPNGAVDRIVPDQNNENPLDVLVEPYFEWVIETKNLKEGHKKIEGVTYVQDITPYIERKLFTVNTGHGVVAYAGAEFEHKTIQEAMKDERVVKITKEVLMETGKYLVKNYDFTMEEHEKYIHKILGRFANPSIVDEITRVGRGIIRKLSPTDRLIKPMLGYYKAFNEIPTGLATVIAYGYHYTAEGDEESRELQGYLKKEGISKGIQHYSGLEEGSPLAQKIIEIYKSL